jgi:uncharacterized repeat protein (TIGR01451 family)
MGRWTKFGRRRPSPRRMIAEATVVLAVISAMVGTAYGFSAGASVSHNRLLTGNSWSGCSTSKTYGSSTGSGCCDSSQSSGWSKDGSSGGSSGSGCCGSSQSSGWSKNGSSGGDGGSYGSGCNSTTITTHTTVSSMKLGQTKTVGDVATLTGSKDGQYRQLGSTTGSGGPYPTGKVWFQLYSDSNCKTAVAGVSGWATIDSNGVASFSPGASFTPDHAGTYYWGVSYAGDGQFQAASVCGGDNEEIVVTPATPRVSTVASPSSVVLGSQASKSVSDTATFTGGYQLSGQSVAFTLYSDASCASATSVTGTATIGAGGSATFTGDASSLPVGTYYWGVSYGGDANNTSVSACGGENETLTITPAIDLAVTKVGKPNPVSVHNTITWTMVVTNNGPDTATGVKTADPLPMDNTFVSVATTKGTCTGGLVISCDLGTMAVGEQVTITLKTIPTVANENVTNTVTVVGNEPETNTANNTATATVHVIGSTKPPKQYCTKVTVQPKQLYVGRKALLKIKLTQHGKPARGVKVRIIGPKIRILTKPSGRHGKIEHKITPKKAGIIIFKPTRTKSCKNPRVGITGVFTPPVTG